VCSKQSFVYYRFSDKFTLIISPFLEDVQLLFDVTKFVLFTCYDIVLSGSTLLSVVLLSSETVNIGLIS